MKRRSFLKGALAVPAIAATASIPITNSGVTLDHFAKTVVDPEMAKMGNVLLTPSEVTKKALALLHKNLEFHGPNGAGNL